MTDRDKLSASRDPYHTLDVGAEATDEEIARAYRHLARTHHPDANPGAAGAAFAGLTDAYDVLRDPDRRRRYDQTRDTRAAAARAAAATRIPVRTIGTRRPPASCDPHSAARAGDVEIVVPTALTDWQRSALAAFAEATPSPRSHLGGHRRPATTNPPPDPGEGAP